MIVYYKSEIHMALVLLKDFEYLINNFYIEYMM
jgi:hypothetical protein